MTTRETTHETIAIIDGRTKANGLAYTARIIREERPRGPRFDEWFNSCPVIADVIRAGLYRMAKEDEQLKANLYEYLYKGDVANSVIAIEKAEATAQGFTQKPRRQVLDLMTQWATNSWDSDLEDTEGFEFHRGELRNYRLRLAAQKEAARDAEFKAFAGKIGCTHNHALALHIERLEARIAELEARE